MDEHKRLHPDYVWNTNRKSRTTASPADSQSSSKSGRTPLDPPDAVTSATGSGTEFTGFGTGSQPLTEAEFGMQLSLLQELQQSSAPDFGVTSSNYQSADEAAINLAAAMQQDFANSQQQQLNLADNQQATAASYSAQLQQQQQQPLQNLQDFTLPQYGNQNFTMMLQSDPGAFQQSLNLMKTLQASDLTAPNLAPNVQPLPFAHDLQNAAAPQQLTSMTPASLGSGLVPSQSSTPHSELDNFAEMQNCDPSIFQASPSPALSSSTITNESIQRMVTTAQQLLRMFPKQDATGSDSTLTLPPDISQLTSLNTTSQSVPPSVRSVDNTTPHSVENTMQPVLNLGDNTSSVFTSGDEAWSTTSAVRQPSYTSDSSTCIGRLKFCLLSAFNVELNFSKSVFQKGLLIH